MILNFIIGQPYGRQFIELATYFPDWIKKIGNEIVYIENDEKENVLNFLNEFIHTENLQIEKTTELNEQIRIYLDNSEIITKLVKANGRLAISLNDGYIMRKKDD